MTAIDRNNNQNQFYWKQARLSLNEGIQISRVRDKINREKESLTASFRHDIRNGRIAPSSFPLYFFLICYYKFIGL